MADQPSIFLCLAAVKDGIGAVGKDQRNTIQNFNFRGVDAVVNAAAPLLNKHGVITVPCVDVNPVYETVEVGAKRTPMAHVILRVTYYFWGPAGDNVAATVVAESMDSGDKAIAKAMSVAYRTALLQVLNLPTMDKDPDEEIFERSAPETKAVRSSAPRSSRMTYTHIKTAQGMADVATAAADVESLRDIYKASGTAGFLKETVHLATGDGKPGESLPLEDYLQRRNGEITHPKSTGAAGKDTRGGGDQ